MELMLRRLLTFKLAAISVCGLKKQTGELIYMEWKGKYVGFEMRTSKDKRTSFASHRIMLDGTETKFTSFKMPEALKNAEGKMVTVQIIQSGQYFNLDENAEIKVEEQTTLQKQEEQKQTEEQVGEKLSEVRGVLTQTMLDAADIFKKTFGPEERKEMSADKQAELICSMGMHLSNNFHR